MAKIEFDIKYRPQIESGEYKVATRDDRPARIVFWDNLDSVYPILAYIIRTDGSAFISSTYTSEGKVYIDSEHKWDLFIITPEPELTEFEKEICGVSNLNLNYNMKEEVRAAATHVLALAREEIAKEDEFEISAV